MNARRFVRFGVEGLEPRAMLSGAASTVHASALPKGATMPYQELTLKGHFAAGAPTTVTFAARHGATVTVTPAAVTSTAIVVAVPAFFDTKTGQAVAATASVSVHQTIAGKAKSTQVLKSLAVAPLPKTGLMAGDVLGAVTVAAASVTADAGTRFAHLSGTSTTLAATQPVASLMADLAEIGALIPQAQQLLVSLAFGSVASVPLGTYQGQAATLDVSQLGLLDRIVAGGVDVAAGSTTTGTALVASLGNLVSGALAGGPSAVAGRAMQVVDVLGTATGSPVVPPGSVVTGLALGSLSAVVAAAEVEALVIQGAFSPSSTLGPSDLVLVDRVLDDPALGQALNALTAGFVPTTPAGQALAGAAQLAEALAAAIDPSVPGSAGALFATELKTVPLHQG